MRIRALGQKMPWKRKWQPAPVFLPGKFHGQRSLAGCRPWGLEESDMTEYTYTQAGIYNDFKIKSKK